MRSARGLLTLVTLALTIVAAIGSTAHAQDLELTEELTGIHCPPVTVEGDEVSGGCALHFVTEHPGIDIWRHLFGIEAHYANCPNEFVMRLDETGAGYISELLIAPTACSPVELCPGQGPQAIQLQETAPGEVRFAFTICFRRVGTAQTSNCPMDVLVTADGTHDYELRATDDPCVGTLEGAFPEVNSAHWLSETTDMEIVHL